MARNHRRGVPEQPLASTKHWPWLRCLWILYHLFVWCLEFANGGLPFRLLEPLWYHISERLCFVFMVLAFGRVLWSSLMTSRDTFSNSLLLAGASMISFAFWGDSNMATRDWLIPGQDAFVAVFLGYTFPVLCHCNVHPVVLLLLFTYTMGYTFQHMQDEDAYLHDIVILLHMIVFQLCIGCAFSLDFTKRVKAVATGMLHNADTFDPLESPVAGRSARGFCWLVLINNWVFIACFCGYSWDSSIYPSWMYILDTICLCLPWGLLLVTRSPNCTHFKSDVAFVSFSYAPPTWVLLRHNFVQASGFDFLQYYEILLWVFGAVALACRSIFFATQAAIQAGCIPFVCIVGFLFVTIIFVVTVSSQDCWGLMSQSGYAIPLVVSLAAWLHVVLFEAVQSKPFAETNFPSRPEQLSVLSLT